jgi:hypothetical protein
MIHLANITAVFLSALIESWRIKAVKGRWLNVPKWVSLLIGAGLFAMVLWLFHGSKSMAMVIPEMIFTRAALYDPFLNKLRALKWDYVSNSTNSWLDRLEAKIGLHFVAQRALYGLIALLFLILYTWK